MAAVHIDEEHQRILVRLQRAQLGRVLGGLPVHHLRVVKRRLHQDRWIRLGCNVVIRRVGQHVVERGLLIRIAPLFVLRHRQRKRRVQHGVHHVHERHLAQHHLEQVRTHVGDRAHQQAARARALNADLAALAVACRQQVLGRVDEVGKGVALGHHLAGIVPGLAHLAAAADMRDGRDHAAVQQGQIQRAEHILR